MFPIGIDRRWLARVALVVLLATAGCLGADARGGEVAGTSVASAPPDVDAVDHDAVRNAVIGRVVDEACAAGEVGEQVGTEFDPAEERAVRTEYERLDPTDGDLFVRCRESAGVVRLELRLYT